MNGHVALHAFPVLLRYNVFQRQRQLVLGQPVGNFDLSGDHGRLQRAQLLPYRSFGAGFGFGCHLSSPILGGRFASSSGVKLDGEGGVAVGRLRRRRCTGPLFPWGVVTAHSTSGGGVFRGDLKVARLLIGRRLRTRL